MGDFVKVRSGSHFIDLSSLMRLTILPTKPSIPPVNEKIGDVSNNPSSQIPIKRQIITGPATRMAVFNPIKTL